MQLSSRNGQGLERYSPEVVERLKAALPRTERPTLGRTGYVILYRVGPVAQVSVLAARHQLEERFH